MILQKDHESLLHPKLLELLPEIQRLAWEFYDAVEENRMPENFLQRRHDLLIQIVVKEFDGVYRAPYLSDKACWLLREQSENWRWSPNYEEDFAYQMNEVVLAHEVPFVHKIFKGLYEDALVPLWMLLSGTMASSIQSIQLAKYLPDDRPSTGWHFDDDSECTTVVELSEQPELTGASLKVFPDLNLGLAKMGWVTMFNGRTVLHATEPVTAERKILVHWTYRE